MKPQFLFVKLHRIPRIAKKQAVFDQHDTRRLEFQARVIDEQLVWEDE